MRIGHMNTLVIGMPWRLAVGRILTAPCSFRLLVPPVTPVAVPE